jgi:AcrR family transcriptional regulator
MTAEDLQIRRYRGTSIAERKTQRRDLLLRAAIRIYGETGYRNATVKAVCEAAGLTERYFYESFANSEALLIAAYERVNQQLIDEIGRVLSATTGASQEKGKAALGYYFSALRHDPKLARMFLIELSGVSPAVERAQSEAQNAFANLLLQALDPSGKLPMERRDLLAHGVVGAIASMALHWIGDNPTLPVEHLVVAALDICAVLTP